MATIDVRKMSPDEKERFHREAETRLQALSYAAPASDRPKDVVMMGRTERMRAMVQIVRDGGENNLHYHTNSDTTWLVMKGRVRFYGLRDKLIGEYGPGEGIMVPGGARYWFEKAGDETLEILQIVAYEPGAKAERINLDQHKDWMKDEQQLTVYE